MNPKVAIIFDISQAGGVQTCVFSLIKGLNQINNIPTVFWDTEPNIELLKELGLKLNYEKLNFNIKTNLIRKFSDTGRYLLWPFNKITDKNFVNRYDFVFSFTPLYKPTSNLPHLIYLSGPPLLPQLNSTTFKFKVVEFLYSVFFARKFPFYRLNPDAGYVINSIFTKNLFYEAHNLLLDVIYPSNQFKKKEVCLKLKENKVVYFSRILPYKKPDLVLKLASSNPTMDFIIMGGVNKENETYFKELQSEIFKLSLKNIQFVINPNKSIVERILIESKFYFFPASNEHFGITTVEAILCGCIPFVHNSGGQIEIVPYEELRFEYENFVEKFDYLRSLDEDALMVLVKNLQNHMEIFEEEIFIKKMLDKMNSLLKLSKNVQ